MPLAHREILTSQGKSSERIDQFAYELKGSYNKILAETGELQKEMFTKTKIDNPERKVLSVNGRLIVTWRHSLIFTQSRSRASQILAKRVGNF